VIRLGAGGAGLIALFLLCPATPASAAPEPFLSVFPQPVAAGGTAVASGAGFCPAPCGTVSLTVDGKKVATTGGLAVTSGGSFSTSFVAPVAGDHYLQAVQRGSDGTMRTAGTRFAVNGVEDEEQAEVKEDLNQPLSPAPKASDLLDQLAQAQRDLASPPPAKPVPPSPGTRTTTESSTSAPSSTSASGISAWVIGAIAAAAALVALLASYSLHRHRSGRSGST
jgi:hypothetical protein